MNPTKEKEEGAGGKPLRDNDSEEIKKGKRGRDYDKQGGGRRKHNYLNTHLV